MALLSISAPVELLLHCDQRIRFLLVRSSIDLHRSKYDFQKRQKENMPQVCYTSRIGRNGSRLATCGERSKKAPVSNSENARDVEKGAWSVKQVQSQTMGKSTAVGSV